jgi:hypothetical protein
MKTLSVLFAASVFSTCALGCSEAARDETGSAQGAATAKARTQLQAFQGIWRIDVDYSKTPILPERISIEVTDDAVDPTTGATKGTRLRLMRPDSNAPAIDRAPFIDVDEGKACENVGMGGGSSITVCHETTLSNGGRNLTHTVTMRAWEGYVFPGGWSEARQDLLLENDGTVLHYNYVIDGVQSTNVDLIRP